MQCKVPSERHSWNDISVIHLVSASGKWPLWAQVIHVTKMTLPSCPNTSNWGASLYHFPECSAVIWQMGQEWRNGGRLGATHPPVTAVKGLRSNHLHMTTRPAPHLNSEWLMRPCGTPSLVLFSGGRVICMIAARERESWWNWVAVLSIDLWYWSSHVHS